MNRVFALCQKALKINTDRAAGALPGRYALAKRPVKLGSLAKLFLQLQIDLSLLTIKIHHFGPSPYKILIKFRFGIIRGIYLCYRT